MKIEIRKKVFGGYWSAAISDTDKDLSYRRMYHSSHTQWRVIIDGKWVATYLTRRKARAFVNEIKKNYSK
jgi:hypothetical protein